MKTRRTRIFTQFIADYKGGEFHITPVLTLAWPDEKTKDGSEEMKAHLNQFIMFCFAFEWGFWAVTIGYWHIRK